MAYQNSTVPFEKMLLNQHNNINDLLEDFSCKINASELVDNILELKLNQNAEIAMKQIDLQQYADRFALCGLPVVKVAINFSAETRTIADWVISRGTYA